MVSIPEPDIDTERDKTHRDLSHFEKRACLSYWGPKTQELASPATDYRSRDLTPKMLSEKGEEFRDVVAEVQQMAKNFGKEFGWPLFFRTGQTSGKHNWNRTCKLEAAEDVESHMRNLAQHSHIVSMVGLPLNVWAVREWLDIEHKFTAFGGMPIGREFRYFVQEGKIIHEQPYWPPESIEGHTEADRWEEKLRKMNGRSGTSFARSLAQQVAERIEERFDHPDSCWSVDVCKTETRGWMMTDMAPAERSYFWDPDRRFESLEEKIGEQNLNLPSNQSA